MLFVDVDPALLVPEKPKDPKFYSEANTQLASTVKKPDATMPEIKGKQQKFVKTTEDAKPKAKPLQPSAPKQDKPKTDQAEAKPKKSDVRGDLDKTKPDTKLQVEKSETESEKGEEPALPHQRPRLLSEVSKKTMAGEKSHQDGGARNVAVDSLLDVAQTSYGNYDKALIDAIKNNWDGLIDENRNHNSGPNSGQTVIEFTLWYDGSIRDVRMVENSSGEIPGLYCKQAILHTNPFRKWPSEMRHEIGADFREVRFSFYYLPHE